MAHTTTFHYLNQTSWRPTSPSFPFTIMEVKKDQHTSPPSETIPIVDLSNPDEELVSRAVVKASQEWGIFHVVNHGISMDLIRRLKEVGTQFFELPETEKKAVAKPDDSQDFEGYTRNLKYTEGEVWADNLFHRILPQSCINYKYWPRNPPQYRYEESLGYKLMELITLIDTFWLSFTSRDTSHMWHILLCASYKLWTILSLMKMTIVDTQMMCGRLLCGWKIFFVDRNCQFGENYGLEWNL